MDAWLWLHNYGFQASCHNIIQVLKNIYVCNDNILLCTGRDSGVVTLKQELPHTITEWIGTTVCVSPHLGLGISPPTHLTAFQPFFLDYSMPYSVKRGEVVQLKVSLFNFLPYSLPVCMPLCLCVSPSSVVNFAC
jgi:hypothetical protein